MGAPGHGSILLLGGPGWGVEDNWSAMLSQVLNEVASRVVQMMQVRVEVALPTVFLQ